MQSKPSRPQTLSSSALKVLGIVLTLYSRGKHITVRTVANGYNGKENVAWVHLMLLKLRKAGLVAWEDGKNGTIVPTCYVRIIDQEATSHDVLIPR